MNFGLYIVAFLKGCKKLINIKEQVNHLGIAQLARILVPHLEVKRSSFSVGKIPPPTCYVLLMYQKYKNNNNYGPFKIYCFQMYLFWDWDVFRLGKRLGRVIVNYFYCG